MVIENFEHYISRHIRSFYAKRLISPVLFLLLLLVLSFFYPIMNLMYPIHITEDDSLSKIYKKNTPYVTANLSTMYFTGYRQDWLGINMGYYYYTMYGDDCLLVLLTPKTSQEGNPEIEGLSITAELKRGSVPQELLLERLNEDITFHSVGVDGIFSEYMLSETDGNGLRANLLRAFITISVSISLLFVALYLIYIAFPYLCPAIRKLGAYGSPKKILAKAEEELLTLPQLATEDMFITEHYFIETSTYGVAVVPINRIIWIYKYSTLHKLLWHHFSISYTLYITAGKRQYIKCPKNTKTDIDGIMDYLAEANHNILVGFSEENRRAVEEIQGDFAPLRKLWAFLSRRV